MLPAANIDNLMLRNDVVEAIRAGRFHIYAVNDVDQALEILTDLPVGRRRADGTHPRRGIHAQVDRRLQELAGALRETSHPADARRDGTRPARPGGGIRLPTSSPRRR